MQCPTNLEAILTLKSPAKIHSLLKLKTDLTLLSQIDPPLPQWIEEEEAKHTEVKEGKYKLKPPRDLRSKFLMMMAQREIDKEIAENEEIAEQARLKILVGKFYLLILLSIAYI